MTLDLWNEIADAKKINIMKAALKIFAEKGYDGATTRMIANEAGIANGLLFYHYQDKETLFIKLALHLRTVVAKELSVQISAEGDLYSQLRKSISQKLVLCAEYPDVYRFFLIQLRQFPDVFQEQGHEVRSVLSLRHQPNSALHERILLSALDGLVSALIEAFYAGKLTGEELLRQGMEQAEEYIQFFQEQEQ